MTTDNKLFQSILQSGRTQAESIEREAEEAAAALLRKAEEDAENEAQASRRAAERQAEKIRHAAQSSASLLTRNAVLSAKRKEIDAAIDGIGAYVNALDDSSYFALLYKIAGAVRGDYEAVYLNERDLKRAPSDFAQQLQKAGVNAALAAESADIENGFLLKNGAIETNCSVAAIIEDRRSDIEDFINRALFAQEEE